MGHILRVPSFLRLAWLVHSPVRVNFGVDQPFDDDALAYCTERMDPETTRLALAATLQQAKRNKAFENSRFIGLALDGTGAGRTDKEPCRWCDPILDAQGEGYGANTLPSGFNGEWNKAVQSLYTGKSAKDVATRIDSWMGSKS